MCYWCQYHSRIKVTNSPNDAVYNIKQITNQGCIHTVFIYYDFGDLLLKPNISICQR